MSNIYNDFRKELGYVNSVNQYIELSNRYFLRDNGDKQCELNELAQSFRLTVSQLPDGYQNIIAKGYIVSIHSTVESFLLKFKDLAGPPTHGRSFHPDNDGDRLKWTMNLVCKTVADDTKLLYNICNYYRLIRNRVVHTGGPDAELNKAYTLLRKMPESKLCSHVTGKLCAPNTIHELSFDDQVLFSRAAKELLEKFYYDSNYNWTDVISHHRVKIAEVMKPHLDDHERAVKCALNYLQQFYPLKQKSALQELLQQEISSKYGTLAER